MFRLKGSSVKIEKTKGSTGHNSHSATTEDPGVSNAFPEAFWEIDEAGIISPRSGICYEIAIDIFFNARHHVTIGGSQGPEHGHSYRLQVRCRSRSLAHQDYIIIGYHTLRERIRIVASAYNNQFLNELPPFKQTQPTTENLTAVIYQQLSRTLRDLPIDLVSVSLWDSPTESITVTSDGLGN
jgi:6-pyruvoyltetrahydropterin/6-carboxytetrahydropterin synthase